MPASNAEINGQFRDPVTRESVSYRLTFTVMAKTYVFVRGDLFGSPDVACKVEEARVEGVQSLAEAEARAEHIAQNALARHLSR